MVTGLSFALPLLTFRDEMNALKARPHYFNTFLFQKAIVKFQLLHLKTLKHLTIIFRFDQILLLLVFHVQTCQLKQLI